MSMKNLSIYSKITYTSFFVFITTIILFFASSSSNTSSYQSGFLLNTISSILNLLNIHLEQAQIDVLHMVIRKLIGHFALFGLDGIFGYLTFDSWFDWDKKKKFLITIIVGFLIATVSEVIQAFVPERGPSFVDVFIDLSGFILGVLFILLIQKIQRVSSLKKNPS